LHAQSFEQLKAKIKQNKTKQQTTKNQNNNNNNNNNHPPPSTILFVSLAWHGT